MENGIFIGLENDLETGFPITGINQIQEKRTWC